VGTGEEEKAVSSEVGEVERMGRSRSYLVGGRGEKESSSGRKVGLNGFPLRGAREGEVCFSVSKKEKKKKNV